MRDIVREKAIIAPPGGIISVLSAGIQISTGTAPRVSLAKSEVFDVGYSWYVQSVMQFCIVYPHNCGLHCVVCLL